MSGTTGGGRDTRPVSARQVDAWGRVSFSADDAFRLIYEGALPEALLLRPDGAVDTYNHWCDTFDKGEFAIPPLLNPPVSPAGEHSARAERWSIPERFLSLDVQAMLLSLCTNDVQAARVRHEMAMFAERGHIPLLRAMVALVEHFRETKVVWGVGRGSSVASYCLFLIGIHRIDAIRYGLDIGEFLKPLPPVAPAKESLRAP